MKTKIIFLALLTFLFQINSVDAQKKRPAPKPTILSAREIAAKVLPSVVLIITQDENGNAISQGSGFVYKPGLIVSNLHVFERASNAIVKDVKTGKISKALEVVGINAKQDICIIRIDDTSFPSISVGDSWEVQTGDEIYVASNPKGLEGSFTKGIVSGVREKGRPKAPKNGEDEYTKLARDAWTLDDQTLFQIDAAISAGSSGGLLVNTSGQAIGIVKSSVVSGQNLNFAIPIEQLTALPLEFNHPIKLAGSCALSGVEEAGLKGRVKVVWEDGLIFRYDEVGNEVSREFGDKEVQFTFDLNGLPISRIEKEKGTVIKQIRYDRATSIELKLDRRISAGRKGSLKDGELWTYNRNGDIESFVLANSRTVIDFDDDGRKVRERTYINDLLSSERRFEYKVDQFGNWIEKTEYKRASPDSGKWREEARVNREIEYYRQ